MPVPQYQSPETRDVGAAVGGRRTRGYIVAELADVILMAGSLWTAILALWCVGYAILAAVEAHR